MEYLLKASVVIALFYMCYRLFLHHETFFRANRWFLLLGIVTALVFPLITIPVYVPMESIVIPETTLQIVESVKSNTINPEPVLEWQSLIPILYAIGFIAFFVQFLFQFGSLVWLLLKNPKNKECIYTYVIVKDKISPFSFFKWIVFNPDSYYKDELELILTHEKVHVNQFHSIDILFTQLACVIFWFNPLMWLYRNEVSQNLEYVADSETQTISKNEREYQRLLLKTSMTNHHTSLSNHFYNSQIKKRIIMLHKSKSNVRKQWKYLLMFPLLAGLLISMNTKKVFLESGVVSEESKSSLEFIVDKNTTEDELKQMSKAIEEKGGTLIFNQIERNSKMELTSIFLKLNNHSYGGDFGGPIEPFIIYKEFFGEGGGYVGRINGATLHFDNGTNSKKSINELTQRAHEAILKLGIHDEDEYKEIKEKRTKHKERDNDSKSMPQKSTKKSKTSKPNDNAKSLAMASPMKPRKIPQKLNNISITVINKNTTDKELDKIKANLKKEGVNVKFKGVKRNDKGEITAIKIEAKSENSNTRFNINSDEAIEPIKIVFDEKNNSISVGNGHARHGENTVVYETKPGNHKIHKSGSGSNVIVISDDEHEHEHNEDHDNDAKIIVRSNGKKDKIKKIRSSSEVHVISTDDDDAVIEVIVDENDNSNEDIIITKGKKANVIKGKNTNAWVTRTDDTDDSFVIEIDDSRNNIFIADDNGKNPLIIIDGKEVSRDKITEMDTNKIESVTVLKDKSAIAKYGKKGKDGVIIIKTKKN